MDTSAVLFVRTAPASPDLEDEYNAWYDEVHIPQILAAVPGIVAAHRFRLHSSHGNPAGTAPYLAVYEIEDADPGAVLEQLGQVMGTGEVEMSNVVTVVGAAPFFAAPARAAEGGS